MPWKECSVVDERLQFVARLLDGEAMSEVCREFGISRKTGYNVLAQGNRWNTQNTTLLPTAGWDYPNRSQRPVEQRSSDHTCPDCRGTAQRWGHFAL
jgi:hypothetical protein